MVKLRSCPWRRRPRWKTPTSGLSFPTRRHWKMTFRFRRSRCNPQAATGPAGSVPPQHKDAPTLSCRTPPVESRVLPVSARGCNSSVCANPLGVSSLTARSTFGVAPFYPLRRRTSNGAGGSTSTRVAPSVRALEAVRVGHAQQDNGNRCGIGGNPVVLNPLESSLASGGFRTVVPAAGASPRIEFSANLRRTVRAGATGMKLNVQPAPWPPAIRAVRAAGLRQRPPRLRAAHQPYCRAHCPGGPRRLLLHHQGREHPAGRRSGNHPCQQCSRRTDPNGHREHPHHHTPGRHHPGPRGPREATSSGARNLTSPHHHASPAGQTARPNNGGHPHDVQPPAAPGCVAAAHGGIWNDGCPGRQRTRASPGRRRAGVTQQAARPSARPARPAASAAVPAEAPASTPHQPVTAGPAPRTRSAATPSCPSARPASIRSACARAACACAAFACEACARAVCARAASTRQDLAR